MGSKSSTMPGPGYATPLDAMKNGPKEEILYVCCVQPDRTKQDLLATVDINPESPTFCQIIHRLPTGQADDELHHSGWNVCSSCHPSTGCCSNGLVRDKLVLPCLNSDRVLIVDTGKDPRAPSLHKAIDSKVMHSFGCATPHTAHCVANGDIMISCMGDPEGNGQCEFVLIDSKTLEMKGTWTNGKKAKFAYDFWYQPYHDVLISTEWGTPRVFKRGFRPADPKDGQAYGTCLNFFKWSTHELIQTIDLGQPGAAPLEVRFLHNPKEAQGYVGCAVMANVYRFYKGDDGSWKADKVIDIPSKKVSGWMMGSHMQGMMTDILISLDDKYLYFTNWVHGDVRQYDITDRAHPKLTGQIFLGGKILKDSPIQVLEDLELKEQPDPVYIKGKRLHGGPQMLQLSLDGKRLYVSSSLFSVWDKQFYEETMETGSFLVKIDVDVENGGMKVDENFLVDFGEGPDGPVLAHEMRYPGGDCTSDIWLAN